MKIFLFCTLLTTSAVAFSVGCSRPANAQRGITAQTTKTFEVTKTKAEWQKKLSKERFHVLREAGTERAFTGEFWDHKKAGTYVCAGCGQPLYASKDKFKSGTGWPSYTRALNPKSIVIKRDSAFGMVREELLCSRCGGHLGHVFRDGPKPTGDRHCINSASLLFETSSAVKATSVAPKSKPLPGKK